MDQTEQLPPNNGGIQNYFYGIVHNVIYGDYHAHAPVHHGDEKAQAIKEKPESKVPTFDEMMQVFKKMNSMGFWISKRSWGVGFQMWQIWGYKGTIQDYVKLVQNCPDMKRFSYQCDENAVYKMMSKGHLSLHLEKWRGDGVLEPYCILGERINEELLKVYPPEELETDDIME